MECDMYATGLNLPSWHFTDITPPMVNLDASVSRGIVGLGWGTVILVPE